MPLPENFKTDLENIRGPFVEQKNGCLHIKLVNRGLSEADISALITLLSGRSIDLLNLECNNITDDNAQLLATAIKANQLQVRRLYLSKNRIGTVDALALSDCSTLSFLDIDNNPLYLFSTSVA